MTCELCLGTMWTCEEHPDKPFFHTYSVGRGWFKRERLCHGAGEPCLNGCWDGTNDDIIVHCEVA